MNKILKYAVIMMTVGGIISLLLTLINMITEPIIEKEKINRVSEVLNKVSNIDSWKSGNDLIDINNDSIEEVYLSYKDGEIKYYGYLISTKGYSDGKIETIVFIDNNTNKIHSVNIISIEGQTKGIGSQIIDDENYIKIFNEVDVKKYANDSVNKHNSGSSDIISGATISSKAVVEAVIIACNNFYNEVN